jgi:MoaA/NifB/PqqE/SkfB family radical SAM enzyme
MKPLPDWLRGRPSSASRTPVIQIEVTSRCQTQCIFCPRQWLKELGYQTCYKQYGL